MCNIQPQATRPILFFDGFCGLCNHFINFLFYIDQNRLFDVAALQGETAKQLLKQEFTSNLKTLVVYHRGQVKIKSEAVAFVLLKIGGFWKILGFIISILPNRFCDRVYDLIASNRYSYFGKRPTCRMPTPDEVKRFLS